MVGLVVLISQVALLLRLVTLVALAYMTCLPTLSTYMTYLADLSSLNLKKKLNLHLHSRNTIQSCPGSNRHQDKEHNLHTRQL